ncbi:ABC transporter substrate-binding protein [Salipaludibacillus sp. LMS25]|jgi:iron complex transport system substrate-binding protein|uniref:ABC transporter substrate-binding protein n=1 Tax=Salipaludibacillus sp. LMS25 TaxID=2924031 RepID=UPI0020D0697B|nr:ABC transporter substrate-binding protein [Salipaludibacillus sp. LMS25]UTR13164.1 ABC transporter substrate-binding protein [Salipaludibacillus sp. LMS25]
MYKKLLPLVLMISVVLAACGNEETMNEEGEAASSNKTEENAAEQSNENHSDTDEAVEGEEITVSYLGEDYTVVVPTDKIVAASQEAMEDAAILGIKPIGAVAHAGEFPDYLGDSMSEAAEIGDKMQPNNETLLQLEPDVILGTSKFQPEVVDNLKSVAPMIPISHIATNWKENLLVTAEVAGKTEEAENIIEEYETDVAELSESLAGALEDQQVIMVRIRSGDIFVYGEEVYFNPVLYGDLGLTVPDEVAAAESQEMITLEKLAEMNPDHMYVQFEETENADAPEALNELESNDIWNSIEAVKNDNVYVNAIDPLAAGGTAWSKTEFLNVVTDTLTD